VEAHGILSDAETQYTGDAHMLYIEECANNTVSDVEIKYTEKCTKYDVQTECIYRCTNTIYFETY
jgi:hypothetical protein